MRRDAFSIQLLGRYSIQLYGKTHTESVKWNYEFFIIGESATLWCSGMWLKVKQAGIYLFKVNNENTRTIYP